MQFDHLASFPLISTYGQVRMVILPSFKSTSSSITIILSNPANATNIFFMLSEASCQEDGFSKYKVQKTLRHNNSIFAVVDDRAKFTATRPLSQPQGR